MCVTSPLKQFLFAKIRFDSKPGAGGERRGG